MGNASQINRSRNSVRVERRSDLNESDLGEVYCIYHFRCKFFGCFRLLWLLFRYVIVVFETRWNSVPSTSRHGYVVQQSINCLNCFSTGISSKQSTRRARLPIHPRSLNLSGPNTAQIWIFRKGKSESLSFGMFSQPVAS